MNILLLSMPDSFEHMPTVAIRMPNGALTSLAGNVDPKHKVAVADLDPVSAHRTRDRHPARPRDRSRTGRSFCDDIPTPNRQSHHRADPQPKTQREDRRRWLRSQPRFGCISFHADRLHHSWRG